ncbi:MAG TPA: acyl-CoA dehydratase activase-related protein [Thermodesulfobacteriota bacterium]|jgi:predicted nucleotide-binding protein (sugar kinase/HSP70/actin superfamily)|nr:acyl-CoA dehydratase activase-related protein [Thermodesulfobacteriota bacterium]
MEEKGRIGIPRALMFYRYLPLWRPFFERLGWRVMISDGTRQKEKIIYFEDSCLPMKLLVTHAVQLKDKVDHLFVPRLVSIHRAYIMCPKFRGAPDIVRLATGGNVSIIDETVDLRERGTSLLQSFLKIGEKLGASRQESKRVFREAQKSFSKFQKDWADRINRLPTGQVFEMDVPMSPVRKKALFRIAFIGHPYNLFDTDINKDLLALAKSLQMEIVTSDLLSEKEIDREVSDLSKEIYWSSGREIVGSLFHFLSGGVDGVVFLTSFKCGIDALLQEFIKRRLKVQRGASVPLLILSLDEHTGREGLATRLEAFRDVVEQRKADNI